MQKVNWNGINFSTLFDSTDQRDREILARMPDTVKIKNHLLRYGKITSLEAINLYGITRLADVIYKLRRKDKTITIDTEMVYGRDRYGDPTRYGVYHLV